MGTFCWHSTGQFRSSFGQKTHSYTLISFPTIHAISMNTGSISMLLKDYKRVIFTQVLSHYVTHLLCLDGVNLCLFSVNFCQSILILDVDYVLFTKQNALEISSCGRDQFSRKHRAKKPNFILGILYQGKLRPLLKQKPWWQRYWLASNNTHCNSLELQLLISAQTVSFFSFLSLISLSLFSLYLISFSNKSKHGHHRSLSLWL